MSPFFSQHEEIKNDANKISEPGHDFSGQESPYAACAEELHVMDFSILFLRVGVMDEIRMIKLWANSP